MVETQASLRISLVGGGTDYPWFFKEYGGGIVGDIQRLRDGSAEVNVGDVDNLRKRGAAQNDIEQKIWRKFLSKIHRILFLIREIRVIRLIRDSELVRHKHQIKHIDNPIAIHIRGQIARPKPLSHQCQIKDIHCPVAVHVGGAFCFYFQEHVAIQVRNRMAGDGQSACNGGYVFRKFDDLGFSAAVVDRPTVCELADENTGVVGIVEGGFGTDRLAQVDFPEVVPNMLMMWKQKGLLLSDKVSHSVGV